MISLSVEGAFSVLRPLVYLVMTMLIYSAFVFKFYKFISKRDIFELNLSQYSKSKHKGIKKSLGVVFFILEYLVVFPVISLVWVSIISALLFFISKDPFPLITLAAVGVVVTIRATSYFSEELSKELAKLLPLALLVISLMKISNFAFSNYSEFIRQFPILWENVIYYMLFILAFEVVLRIFYSLNLLYPEAKE